jgi:hypothetical protein
MVTNVSAIGLSPGNSDDVGAKRASRTRRLLNFFRRELVGTFGVLLVLAGHRALGGADLVAFPKTVLMPDYPHNRNAGLSATSAFL